MAEHCPNRVGQIVGRGNWFNARILRIRHLGCESGIGGQIDGRSGAGRGHGKALQQAIYGSEIEAKVFFKATFEILQLLLIMANDARSFPWGSD